MRITTAGAYDNGIQELQRRQAELAQTQSQLTSGKRVQRASDDPTGAARAERALASITRSEVGQRALEASRNAMTLTESTLGDANELLQQARETLVAAGNPAYSDAERAGLAARLSGLRGQLLALANRGDGAGTYLFGGQGASQPPFVDGPGGVSYRGIAGQLRNGGDEPLPLTADGQGAWLQARTGNGVFETRSLGSTTAWIDAGQVTDATRLTGASYSLQFSVAAGVTTYSVQRDGVATALSNQPYKAGQAIEIDGLSFTVNGAPAHGDAFEAVPSTATLSVFDTLDRAIADLRTPLRSTAQIAQTNASALRDIDGSLGTLQGLRAVVGETLNRTDAVEGRLAAAKLAGQTERSNAEDLDMLEAISAFQNRQTGYDAALKTYSMVQRLSLFQYLNL